MTEGKNGEMFTTLTSKTGVKCKLHIFTPQEYMQSNELQPAKVKRIRGNYKTGQKQYCIENIITFDIETSRVINGEDENGEPEYFSFMYHWQMCIDGCVIFGRTWEEFEQILHYIHTTLDISEDKKCLIFIHNLAYEMSFLYFRLPILDIFATAPHEPLKVKLAEPLNGFEFRCTYRMTNAKLEDVAKNTLSCPFLKDKEEIDYNEVFTPLKPITKPMQMYCAKDVLIPYFYLKDLMQTELTLYGIPITKTGFIRRKCRRALYRQNEWDKYRRTQKITPEQYYYLNKAFRGGDTHSNAIYNGTIVDAYSFDLTSSYPTRLVTNIYPASPPTKVENMSKKEFEIISTLELLWFGSVWLKDVKCKSGMFNYIPNAKCEGVSKNAIIDNGRIYSADYLCTTLTNIDFEIIKENYNFKLVKIPVIFYYTKSSLLPECFRNFILDLYKTKTELKGLSSDDGSIEKKYSSAKSDINSVYGMCVTKQLRSTVKLINHEWVTEEQDPSRFEEFNEEYTKELNKASNFLPYSIGVFTTAYARQDLFNGLKMCGCDSVYWDTDSCKFINEKHCEDFEKLNKQKLDMLYSLYPIDRIAPKDIHGNRHPLGLWDEEYPKGCKFMTYGAKKYVYEDNATGKNYVTIAGLSKKKAKEFLLNKYGTVLQLKLGQVFDEENSGRTVSQYSLERGETVINGEHIIEYSYMNILPTTYTLGTTQEYKLFIMLALESKGKWCYTYSEKKALEG